MTDEKEPEEEATDAVPADEGESAEAPADAPAEEEAEG